MTDRLLAGEIGKPHGTNGEVYVVKISDDPHRFDPGSELVHGDGRSLVIETARPHRDRFLVKFAGFSTRSEAETLRGPLYVSSEQRRDLDESEFWAEDLIGCKVTLRSGDPVGTVKMIVPGTAHDLMEVITPRGERLVPMVKEIVVSVDVAERVVVLDPPEGLLE